MTRCLRRTWMLVATLVAVGLAAALVSAAAPGQKERQSVAASFQAAVDTLSLPWPLLYSAVETDSVFTAVSCFGVIGGPFTPGMGMLPDYGWPHFGFSVPRTEKFEYLFSAGLMVGGVIGPDTLVSSSVETWLFGSSEFLPPEYAWGHFVGDVAPIRGLADQNVWSHFTDTLHAGFHRNEDISGRPYMPLNLVVSMRAHAWRQGVAANCPIFDVVLTNVGRDAVGSAYVGLLVSPNICLQTELQADRDNVVGALRNENIIYAIDNNGDPRGGRFPSDSSPTQAMAFKLLQVWPQPTDTAFNWGAGVASEGSAIKSFAPMHIGDTVPYGDWGPGYPKGDINLYRWLSNGEWDYDQVMTGVAPYGDTIWQHPVYQETRCIYGADVEYLYSFGPYELLPDSSVRFVFSLFTGGTVHSDPRITDFIPFAPELYLASLDLTGIRASAAVADSLAAVLCDWSAAPTGLRLTSLAGDSAKIEWDPWALDNTDGTALFLVEIPESAFRDRGTPPLWFEPEVLPEPTALGRVRSHTLHGINPNRAYACFIANRHEGATGDLSAPLVIKLPSPARPPEAAEQYCYFVSEPRTSVRWIYENEQAVGGFNIYRFPDSVSAEGQFLPFYSRYRTGQAPADSFVVDGSWYFYYALQPYGTAGATARSFVDTAACEGCVYRITALDTAGFETEFSSPVRTLRASEKEHDILVLTNGGGTYTFVAWDTVRSFYDSLLQGYDYALFNVADSLANGDCLPFSQSCIDWYDLTRYHLVIIDDGIRDNILSTWYEGHASGFTHAVLSGSTLAYFGALSSAGKTLSPTYRPGTFGRDLPFANRFLGVDSVQFTGSLFYKTYTSPPFIDSTCGFAAAEPVADDIPGLSFDDTRYPFSAVLRTYWPDGTPPSAAALVPNSHAEVTHLFRSVSPATSAAEGRPVGVRADVDGTRAFAFGFHLWYMRPADARRLVDWLMQQLPTDVTEPDENATVPRLHLSQNYPNPFNAGTTITFAVPRPSRVVLDIFNVLGQRVSTLVDAEVAAGTYRIEWNGTDGFGGQVASGIYLYRLSVGAEVLTRKMLLLK